MEVVRIIAGIMLVIIVVFFISVLGFVIYIFPIALENERKEALRKQQYLEQLMNPVQIAHQPPAPRPRVVQTPRPLIFIGPNTEIKTLLVEKLTNPKHSHSAYKKYSRKRKS
jgi:hypothetical protein